MYYLSICAIIKNEGKNLKEWINYHIRMGIEHFYIYDNNSTDNTRDVLLQFKGKITYRLWVNQSPCQLDAYMDCVDNFKNDSQWIAFIDADEFIVVEDTPLPDLMKDYEEYAGLGVNWRIYGSSGHDRRPEGNIIDNFVFRAKLAFDANRHIKTIANPRLIESCWQPHAFKYTENYCVTENKELIDFPLTPYHSSKKIYINHYYCKSKEDFEEKQKRARVDIANAGYNWDDFNAHDKNDVYDPLGIDKTLRVIVLYLQYDQVANPYTYIHVQKYLKQLKCKGSTIIISNQEKELYNYGIHNIKYFKGDNSSGEFSGWDSVLDFLRANNVNFDVALFVNDACFNPGCYFDFDSIISDSSITQCARLNTIVGAGINAPSNTIIDGTEIKTFMRTNCFLIAKPKLDKIKLTSITPDFIDKCINRDSELPFWKDDAPLSKELIQFLTEVITVARHTPLNLDTQRPEAIRKVQGYLNEYLLAHKVEQS